MFSKILALAGIAVTALGQTSPPKGYYIGDDEHEAVRVTYDWKFDERDLEENGALMRKWMEAFLETDVYRSGTRSHTVQIAKRNTVLRQDVLFKDQKSADHFYNRTKELRIYPEFEKIKGDMDLYGTAKGSMYNDSMRPTGQDSAYPDLRFEFAYISEWNYGPHLHGVLNSPADYSDRDGPIVLNVAYRSRDMQLTKGFLRGLANHLENEGLFGHGIDHWEIAANPYGFWGTVILNSPAALDEYFKEIDNYAQKDSSHVAMIQIWGQVIGFERDLNQFEDAFEWYNSTVYGAPNLALYGEPRFGYIDLSNDVEETAPDATALFGIVPIFDGVAAYSNYNVWEDTNDDWTLAYLAQGATGSLALLALIISLFAEGFLAKYAILHILLEGGAAFLVYTAETDYPNNIDNATQISYGAAGFGAFMSLAYIIYDMTQ